MMSLLLGVMSSKCLGGTPVKMSERLLDTWTTEQRSRLKAWALKSTSPCRWLKPIG